MNSRNSEDSEFPTPRGPKVEDKYEIISTRRVRCSVNGRHDVDCVVEGESRDLKQVEIVGGAPSNTPAIPVGGPIGEVDGKKHADVEYMMDSSYGFEGDGTCVIFETDRSHMRPGAEMVCGDRDRLKSYDFLAAAKEEVAEGIYNEL